LQNNLDDRKKMIANAIARARANKPAYEELYALLEPLFLIQEEVGDTICLPQLPLDGQAAENNWKQGIPLLKRWDFPVDIQSAETILNAVSLKIPGGNAQLAGAAKALSRAFAAHPQEKQAIWESFLQHEFEPWEEWVDVSEADSASLLFLARSCLRPSIEWTARKLLERFPVPANWLRGYCPVCGSLPSLLFLVGDGERKGHCSWCATQWNLYRLQCPFCDNRLHDSLGYLYIEEEPYNRVQYCRLCKGYFKLVDVRERLDPPFYPLEEWTTLHLDILAQRAGWQQQATPAPGVYG